MTLAAALFLVFSFGVLSYIFGFACGHIHGREEVKRRARRKLKEWRIMKNRKQFQLFNSNDPDAS